MFVLDTDHLSFLGHDSGDPGRRLRDRLEEEQQGRSITTIVTYEEQSRGWLAYLAGLRSAEEWVGGYRRLDRHLDDYRTFEVLVFDHAAASRFLDLGRSKIRVGTMDLRIAAIVLSHDATLLSRNLGDFRQIPGLKVEDWSG